MISAVDTSLIIDVITADPTHGPSSRELLRRALDEGALVICEVVYAEIAPQFASQEELDGILQKLGIQLVNGGDAVAYLAGRKWAEYRRAGGTRARLLADFLIAAHAKVHAERLLARDRGFYRQYFSDLTLLER